MLFCVYVYLCLAGNGPKTAPSDRVIPGELSPDQEASTSLPGSLFGHITGRLDIGIVFGFQNETTLFPVGNSSTSADSKTMKGRQTQVGSAIISATVGINLEFQNLKEPIIHTFQLRDTPGMVRTLYGCMQE